MIVLLHGGFWRWPYGRWLTWRLARAVVSNGNTSVNLGYRRLGRWGGGGGWPATFDDVSDAIDMLAERRPDTPMVLIGHSAGGHLALVGAARRPELVTGAIAIAAPSDLRTLASHGSGPVNELVAGAPNEDRWSLTSPIEMVPIGTPVVCVHSDADETVRPDTSDRFVEAARAAGDDARLVSVAGERHREALDPHSATWTAALGAAGAWLTGSASGSAVAKGRGDV